MSTGDTPEQATIDNPQDLIDKLGEGMFDNVEFVDNLTILDNSLTSYITTISDENIRANISSLLNSGNRGSIPSIKSLYNKSQQENIGTQNMFIRMISQANSGNDLVNELAQSTYETINNQNNQLKNEISNKRRMTEINNYYSNMNTYINSVLKNIVVVVAIIILFTILSKKGVIPSNITNIINILLILAVIVYIIYTAYDINIRDKFNFNEYIIPFDQKAKLLELSGNVTGDDSNSLTDIRKELSKELLGGVNNLENILGTCVGGDCCNTGTIYDYNTSTCITQCPSGETYQKIINPATGKLESKCVSSS